ncbi:MAG: MBOAT family protein [Ignavibacteriaceae bacterium]|nr:MBOAT family protein [Ignavibacteriaceae bacterium]
MPQIDLNLLLEVFKYNAKDPLQSITITFLFIFTGFLFIYQFISSNITFKRIALIVFSFFFYYKAAGEFLGLLILTALISWVIGNQVRKYESLNIKRLLVFAGVILNLGALGYFKYTNFIIDAYNKIASAEVAALDIIQPLGISFFVFKALSYIFDNYYEYLEEKVSVQDFLLYMSFFPSILAGPIDRTGEFVPQIKRTEPLTQAEMGVAVGFLISGLVKKVLISDYISLNYLDRVFQDPLRYTGAENVIASYGYAIRIYCDFSGYTDIALGLALLLGFRLMDNFNAPYQAVSVADFWRRWHISLSSWLQTYLFAPMQMSLRNLKIYGNAIAVLVTFGLCGLWHGANYNFIIWGALHGLFMAVSLLTAGVRKSLIKKTGLEGKPVLKFIRIFITFHLVTIAWVFFATETPQHALDVFSQIFGYLQPEVFGQFITEGYPTVFVLIILGFVIAFFPQSKSDFYKTWLGKMPLPLQALVLAVFIYLAAQVQFADMVPFIYFKF